MSQGKKTKLTSITLQLAVLCYVKEVKRTKIFLFNDLKKINKLAVKSTMASVAKKQDLPPAGGYKRILFARNPAKSYFSGNELGAPFSV